MTRSEFVLAYVLARAGMKAEFDPLIAAENAKIIYDNADKPAVSYRKLAKDEQSE